MHNEVRSFNTYAFFFLFVHHFGFIFKAQSTEIGCDLCYKICHRYEHFLYMDNYD